MCVVLWIRLFVSAGFPACWHVDAPLLPCRCPCWQNLLLRTRFKYGRRCYRVKVLFCLRLTRSCAPCPTSTFCPWLRRERSHFFFTPRTTSAKNRTPNLGGNPESWSRCGKFVKKPQRGVGGGSAAPFLLQSHVSNTYCPPYFLNSNALS